MKASPTRPSPKRDAILDAAKRLFLEEAFDRVSMDAVAAAAGVSKVTIYAHFADKDELFVSAIGAGCQDLFDSALLDAAFDGGLEEALARLGARFVRMITSPDVAALHAVMMAEGRRNPELPRLFHELIVRRSTAILAEALAREAKRGRIACPDPETAAIQFLAMVQGDFTYREQLGLAAPGQTAEIEAFARACAALFARALRAGGG